MAFITFQNNLLNGNPICLHHVERIYKRNIGMSSAISFESPGGSRDDDGASYDSRTFYNTVDRDHLWLVLHNIFLQGVLVGEREEQAVIPFRVSPALPNEIELTVKLWKEQNKVPPRTGFHF